MWPLRAFFREKGTAQPDGFTLKALQVGQSHPLRGGVDRHGGMLAVDELFHSSVLDT